MKLVRLSGMVLVASRVTFGGQNVSMMRKPEGSSSSRAMAHSRKREFAAFRSYVASAILLAFLSISLTWSISSQASIQDRGARVTIRVGNRELNLYAESHALLIGVSSYTNDWGDLPDVVNDIEEVRKALSSQGFEVETLLNPTRSQFDLGIRDFNARFGQAKDNRLLIYYSGHGHTVQTNDNTQRELGYIIPADTPLPLPQSIGLFKSYAVSMSDFITYAEQIEAKHVLFVFDSCFSGSVFRVRSGITPEPISDKTSQPVRQFITAGTEKQQVPARSIFRRVFVDALKGDADTNGDGYVTGTELGEYLHSEVSTQSKGLQTPQQHKMLGADFNRGDFVFQVPKNPNESINRVAEQAYWKAIVASTNPQDFRNYITTFGARAIYFREAQARVKTLEAVELERSYWRQIENSVSPQDFRDYVVRFGTKAVHYNTALTRVRELEADAAERTSWKAIQDSINPRDFSDYINRYGKSGTYYTEALEKKDRLEDLAADRDYWQRIQSSSNPQDFMDYIAKFGVRGTHHDDSQAKLRNLQAIESENTYWRGIENSTNVQDFRNYITRYKEPGVHYSTALAAVNRLEAIEVERGYWPTIVNSKNPQDFREYITKYGRKGIYYDAAARRMNELEAEQTHWRTIEGSSNPQDFLDYANKYGASGLYYDKATARTRELEAAAAWSEHVRKAPHPPAVVPNVKAQPIGTSTGTEVTPSSMNNKRKEPDPPATSETRSPIISLSPVSLTTVILDERGNVVRRPNIQVRMFVEDLGRGVRLDMVEIPGGVFMMGSPLNEAQRNADESPQHQVSVVEFLMGKYEVTQAQWRAVAGLQKAKIDLNPDPSKFKGDTLPVEQVTWEEAVEFCERLSRATGRKYRLPSEAEWEYACRAGTTTPFQFGETIKIEFANYDGSFPYKSAPKGLYRQKTVPVGSLAIPNSLGLFDMHGNVAEWCADSWSGNYNGAHDNGNARETNDITIHRVVRGGNWFKQARDARSAARDHFAISYRAYSVGFRVVLAP